MRAPWATHGCLALLAAISVCAQQGEARSQRSLAGSVALRQAAVDVGCDTRALLVASHPDDRYPLPAAWLRSAFGMRVSVLLASRGGGGQNSLGPETGDGLERIRTAEAEAGGSMLGCEIWYLDRPDNGFRRSAAETFAEWGRASTLRDLVRMLRQIRPDLVASTHHREEQHGHDLALVEILPEAVRLAADPAFDAPGAPHRVRVFLLGGTSSGTADTLRIDVDQLDDNHGMTWRRLAHDVLRLAHRSPGAPAPIHEVFDAVLRLEPQWPLLAPPEAPRPFGIPSLFDVDVWPGEADVASRLSERLANVRRDAERHPAPLQDWFALLADLRALRARFDANSDARQRLDARIEALERVLLVAAGVQIEIEMPPGTVAIGGEEFTASVHLHGARRHNATLRAIGLGGVDVQLEPHDDVGDAGSSSVRTTATFRMPLAAGGDGAPRSYRGDRFVPPVLVQWQIGIGGTELPVTLPVPVDLRQPIELQVMPPMLLLPTDRRVAQFSVGIERNTQFPVVGELEVRAPAAFAMRRDRQSVSLVEQRRVLLGFEVEAPPTRKPGVDVLRVRLGANRVVLPVHTVDVHLPSGLRIGLLRSRDDTLPGILGVGGFGVDWTELSDVDLAVADLRTYQTIVVDARALRERSDARRGFRRLLDFATHKGRRLVLLYQKDSEFQPPGETFLGAPHQPFHVGRARVTRADAPVRVLLGDHVLLNRPNVIHPADWDSWEQERALYLPDTYAQAYQELLEIQDPGQPRQRSALLYARTGDGEYVYCALALVRQLKKLHPGAIRLFANLLTPAD